MKALPASISKGIGYDLVDAVPKGEYNYGSYAHGLQIGRVQSIATKASRKNSIRDCTGLQKSILNFALHRRENY